MALILPAYAKLNLTLDVIGRRENGYHDIDSVMQTISLHDLLWIERTDCRVFEQVGPPIPGQNLVLQAARELEGATSRQLPFTIRLYKRIPMGAGLGGGSADAATFLKAADQLYNLKLSDQELSRIGTEVGQDVPFFLAGGTAHATGLGSRLAPLPPVPVSWRFLVVCPPVEIATGTVYAAVDDVATSGHRTPAVVKALTTPHPYPPLQEGRDTVFGNDLEPVSRRLFPAYDEAFRRLQSLVPSLRMSGTGAALFAVFDTLRQANAALDLVKPLGYPAWVCRPVAATR